MAPNEKPLAVASRIYFGIHYPIQYGVKAKDLGRVHPDWTARFIGYWIMENEDDLKQGPKVTDVPKRQDAN
jgi:hypothetical protein